MEEAGESVRRGCERSSSGRTWRDGAIGFLSGEGGIGCDQVGDLVVEEESGLL